MNKEIQSIFLTALLMACNASPIPRNLERIQQRANEDYLAVRDITKAGDIIFRMGTQPILGGLIDFSKESAQMANSDVSHVCIVIQAAGGTGPSAGLLIANASVYGIERKFFRDWHVGGTENIVVKRVKPEYQFLTPLVLEIVSDLIERDVIYNRNFEYNDETFYCSQMVDYAFRFNGYPLSNLIKIKDLPNYGFIFHGLSCLIGGIDPSVAVVIPGNDQISLFSSPMLETVIDLRRKQ